MALPTITNSDDFGNTLKSLINPNRESSALKALQMNKMSKMFNKNSNGAEGFFSKKIEEMGVYLNDTLQKLNDTINNLSDNQEKAATNEDFWAEQRAEKAVKREEKQTTLLGKILKSIKGGGLFGGVDSKNEQKSGGVLDKLSTFLMGGAGSIGLLGAGALFMKKGVGFLAGVGKLVGGAAIVGSLISGAFDAESISGGDITGFVGAGRIIGSAISKLIQNVTFGLIDEKEVYKFISETIPKFAGEMFDNAKEAFFEVVGGFDSYLEGQFGETYIDLRKSLNEKYKVFKKGFKSFTDVYKKHTLWVVDKYYNASLDIYNWLAGNVAPELGDPRNLGRNGEDFGLKRRKQRLDAQKRKEFRTNDFKPRQFLAKTKKDKHINESGIFENVIKTSQQRINDKVKVSDKKGYCYRGVKETLKQSGVLPKDFGGGGHAYMAGDAFKKAGLNEVTDGWESLTSKDIYNLPAGYIVVSDRTKGRKSGHVAIMMPKGKEYSDKQYTRNVTANRGESARYRVFKPMKKTKEVTPTGTNIESVSNVAQVTPMSTGEKTINSLKSAAKTAMDFGSSGANAAINFVTGARKDVEKKKELQIIPAPQQPNVTNINNNNTQVMNEPVNTNMDNSDGVVLKWEYN